MSYIEIVKEDGGITLKLTREGTVELMDRRVIRESGAEWNKPQNAIFFDLMEDHLANDWEIVRPEELGALTSSLILSDEVERDEKGNIANIGKVYWFPDYAVRSELDELYENGEVFFPAAKE